MLAGEPVPRTEQELLAAVERLEQALKTSPQNVYLMVTLAGAYETLAEVQADVIEADRPGRRPTAFWKNEHSVRARDLCVEVLKIRPDFVYARALLGHLHFSLADYDSARSEYDKVLVTSASDWGTLQAIYLNVIADCHNNLGIIYCHDASQQFSNAINLMQKYPERSQAVEGVLKNSVAVDGVGYVCRDLYAFDHEGNVTYPLGDDA